MNIIHRLIGFALAAAAVLSMGVASAGVIVDIPAGVSWASAITNGNITPSQNGNQLTDAAQQFYSTQSTTLQVMPATLTPGVNNVSDGTTAVDNTLVMSWDLPTNDALAIAWWNYTFDPVNRSPVDMSTGSSMIHFSLYPPLGVWDLSLELIDANGKSRGWFRIGPANVWGTFWISPNLGLPQNPFNIPGSFYWSDPLFDITKVVAIRFDESGMRSTPFPVDPTGNGLAWNAWDSLKVEVPEPATLALLGLGLAGLGLARRRSQSV